MARKTSARVILNRQALTELGQQMAGGVAAFCESVITRARVPDEPPIGRGLVATGGWAVWNNGRKVAGPGAKPRRVNLGAGIVGVAGWGSPIAHLLEFGTVNMRARPFAMPALLEAEGELEGLMRAGMRRGLHP